MTTTKTRPQVAALRVKVKSLAAEAGIIRLEERRALARKDMPLYESLRSHRRAEVRKEQRAALLAYAFVRGRPYSACERPGKDHPPDLERVKQLVEKFGTPVSGWPKYKCWPDVLAKWVAGTLDPHPFAVERPAVAAVAG